MFDIEYKGANSVVITTKDLTLVTDPKLSLVGLKDQSAKDRVELSTEERFTLADESARLVVDGPGEYEVGQFTIAGRAARRHIDAPGDGLKSTIYRISIGDVRIAVLGNISYDLNDDDLEFIGMVDILVIPVGGNGYTLDGHNATKLIHKIEPKVVIPVHYQDTALRYEVPQDDLETFAKEINLTAEKTSKYKIKSASSIPPVLTLVEIERTV